MNVEIPGHTSDVVSYHLLLLKDAGLIESVDLSTMHGFEIRPKRMTWAGHEFWDAARNDSVWNSAKEIVKEKGGNIPFEVLKDLLIKLASSLFGLG